MDLLKYEKHYWSKGFKNVVGIDEAGRGPLAGPVVAACVIIDKNFNLDGINDSKKISPKKRIILYDRILNDALDVSIGIAHEDEIDEINILQATFLAMKRAVGNMKLIPDQLIIDGNISDIKIFPVKNIISGDSKSASIASASIIAKVTRDNLMKEYDKIFPDYGFANHKGYGTKKHIESLVNTKASPIHRKTFKIVNENMPTLSYYNDKHILHNIGSSFIASNYVKNNYLISDKNIELTRINDIIDFLFIKENERLFLKVITISKSIKLSLGNAFLDEIDRYLIDLEQYLIKKEMKKDFTFNVISIEFISNKKPIIKTIYSDKTK